MVFVFCFQGFTIKYKTFINLTRSEIKKTLEDYGFVYVYLLPLCDLKWFAKAGLFDTYLTRKELKQLMQMFELESFRSVTIWCQKKHTHIQLFSYYCFESILVNFIKLFTYVLLIPYLIHVVQQLFFFLPSPIITNNFIINLPIVMVLVSMYFQKFIVTIFYNEILPISFTSRAFITPYDSPLL